MKPGVAGKSPAQETHEAKDNHDETARKRQLGLECDR
jgi:hypothetical protein